jgi:hypothetical protein
MARFLFRVHCGWLPSPARDWRVKIKRLTPSVNESTAAAWRRSAAASATVHARLGSCSSTGRRPTKAAAIALANKTAQTVSAPNFGVHFAHTLYFKQLKSFVYLSSPS